MPIDYKKYPYNWATEIRPAILNRANNCCEVCKVLNKTIVCRGKWNGVEVYQNEDGSIFKTEDGENIGNSYVGDVWDEEDKGLVKVVLTIAHLDNDITNNDYVNLKALCQLHHLRMDACFHRENSAITRMKKKKLQKLF